MIMRESADIPLVAIVAVQAVESCLPEALCNSSGAAK
jgi:hypothetical protein